MIIELIRKSYDGNIEFQKPNESYDLSVPDVLKSVLASLMEYWKPCLFQRPVKELP